MTQRGHVNHVGSVFLCVSFSLSAVELPDRMVPGHFNSGPELVEANDVEFAWTELLDDDSRIAGGVE
jgi:hypothetical protein